MEQLTACFIAAAERAEDYEDQYAAQLCLVDLKLTPLGVQIDIRSMWINGLKESIPLKTRGIVSYTEIEQASKKNILHHRLEHLMYRHQAQYQRRQASDLLQH